MSARPDGPILGTDIEVEPSEDYNSEAGEFVDVLGSIDVAIFNAAGEWQGMVRLSLERARELLLDLQDAIERAGEA